MSNKEINKFIKELDKITEEKIPGLLNEADEVDLDSEDDDMMSWDLGGDNESEEDQEVSGEETGQEVIKQLENIGDGVEEELKLPDGSVFDSNNGLNDEVANTIIKLQDAASGDPEKTKMINNALSSSEEFDKLLATALEIQRKNN